VPQVSTPLAACINDRTLVTPFGVTCTDCASAVPTLIISELCYRHWGNSTTGSMVTVVLGGLMREDVQKVEDKTPFIGDIPLIGRLFRSNVDQHLKRNLLIFVSARLINPAGEPVQNMEEGEEEVVAQPPKEANIPLPEPAPSSFAK